MFFRFLSPILLVATCAVVQWIAGRFIGAWAWVPTMLCFWMTIWLLLRGFSKQATIAGRFGPARGRVVWSVLAVAAGLLALHGFLRHWGLLSEPELIAAWLVFALVNPWFEESYWRGLLMDATASWSKTSSLLYSTAWFAASHPLIWGFHSLPLRKPEALIGLTLVGLAWGLAYQRTHSLRWCVAGHMLANLFGLSALALLNLYDPTSR